MVFKSQLVEHVTIDKNCEIIDISADYNKELGDADSVAELVTEKTGIEFSRHVFQTDPLRKGYISHKFRSHKYGIARIKLDSYRRE